MRGVVFTGERGLELMPFPDPTPDPHDVVIEMKASGMCGSDLHQYRRPKGQAQPTGIPMREGPVIAGHEPCGVVVALGTAVDAREARIGQRVMVSSLSGLHPVQPLPVRMAAALPGGPGQGLRQQRPWRPRAISEGAGQHAGAAAGRTVDSRRERRSPAVPAPPSARVRRMNLSGNDTSAIFGQGPVGLAATQYAKAMGAKVIALDISPQRLERAEAFGADRGRSRLERSGGRDQGTHPWTLCGSDAGYLEQPGRAPECDPLYQSVGHDVLRRRGRRRPHRRQPASVAPATDAGGVMDVLQHHSGRLRAVLGRARHRRRQAVHPPLDPRPGGGSL